MPTCSTRSTVRYVSQGQLVSADWQSNSQTLLLHLREDRRRCGTKEGCAEGDCGACTVVVGELAADQNSVQYRSVNACIYPLSALEGKLLLTVEDLGSPETGLHPVQQAMVACHGSQCGFCTPGFVMSLYDHYLQHPEPTDSEQVHTQLSGNLCRCTGYAPILRAAQQMYDYPRSERDSAADLAQLRAIHNQDETVTLRGAGGDIAVLPSSTSAVAHAYQEHPDATLLAGSTDVGLWITKQKRPLPKVIHLTRASDMTAAHQEADELWIGAGMRLADAAPILAARFPELQELWSRFASPLVRNVATLGGNIANGSPIGDSMPALIALDTRVVLRQADSRREMPLEQLYLGYQKKDLQPGEFVEGIKVPARGANAFVRVYKVSKRLDDDISAVCCALQIEHQQGVIVAARIAYGGMAATPKRASHAEATLTGKPFDAASLGLAVAALAQDFTPLSDHRASASYRMQVAGNLLRRSAIEFAGTEPTRVVHYGGAA